MYIYILLFLYIHTHYTVSIHRGRNNHPQTQPRGSCQTRRNCVGAVRTAVETIVETIVIRVGTVD